MKKTIKEKIALWFKLLKHPRLLFSIVFYFSFLFVFVKIPRLLLNVIAPPLVGLITLWDQDAKKRGFDSMYFKIFYFIGKPFFFIANKKTNKTIMKYQDMILELAKIMEEKGNCHDKEIINIMSYLLFATKDLFNMQYMLIKTKKKEEQKIISRFLAVNIYEIIDDIEQLLGGKYRTDVIKILDGNNTKILQTIDLVKKKVSKVKKDNDSLLYDIRHNYGAHRDHSANNQLLIERGINPYKIFQISKELDCVQYLFALVGLTITKQDILKPDQIINNCEAIIKKTGIPNSQSKT